ncbi:hypothetical protein D9758_002942 [Tetrapyrgos nigripes]|uniref:Uncharacterized protein n=1 Tax=Tetrapyrgos nigripes TaxID=182062 RepID=A0A8H5GQ72_9AGAR|nr:hypothetical protein D9758_002942 [Tetrapyrgos nigripes]
MAPQTSSSSTETAPPAATSTSSPSGPTSSRGANYFFGFLVTFIALLLLFIGCGVGSRRRLNRQRRILFGELEGWNSSFQTLAEPPPEPKLLEPLFEPCLRKTGGEIWRFMQPLSAKLVTVPSTPLKRPPPPVRFPSHNPAAIHGLSLPVWRHVAPTEKEDEGSPEAEIEIAVLIALPRRDEQGRHDYEIGVAHVPWDKGSPT